METEMEAPNEFQYTKEELQERLRANAYDYEAHWHIVQHLRQEQPHSAALKEARQNMHALFALTNGKSASHYFDAIKTFGCRGWKTK